MAAPSVNDTAQTKMNFIAAQIGCATPDGEGLDALEAFMDEHGRLTQCRSCNVPVYFIRHANGKCPPYVGDRNSLYFGLNHFADCPGAQRFRKKR